MKDKIIALLEKYGKLFVLFCIVVSVLGLVISYVFPNKIFITREINPEENSEYHIPLEQGSAIEYQCNTGDMAMSGIQIGISKEGAEFTDGKIIYEIYDSTGALLGAGEQMLKDIYDLQNVYFPFPGKADYNGDLHVKFTYTGSEPTTPSLIANKEQEVEDKSAATFVDGNQIEGNLKSWYIYKRSTYPLVFDLKVMLAIFITVFFTLESKKKQKVINQYE